MKNYPKFFYKYWPYVLRGYELLFHHHRQNFLIGHLSKLKTKKALFSHLTKNGYEIGVIALKDPGEILGMRKRVGKEFQYHIRLFKDHEIRGHFEYSAEAHPIAHCLATFFKPKQKYFKNLLKNFLEKN